MTDLSKHILPTFDTALDALRRDVLMMASLTQRSLQNAVTCLLSQDDELCNVAIADDEEIDQLEKEIDRRGVEILLRFQPVASDLRHVISAMRLSNNLERVADQAVSIAKKARKLSGPPSTEESDMLAQMFQEAMALLRDSIRGYAEGNIDLALSLKARDKKVDDFNKMLTAHLTERIMAVPEKVTDFLNLIFISRHLERVGDHAKNIAEDTVYATSAEDIRHSNATSK